MKKMYLCISLMAFLSAFSGKAEDKLAVAIQMPEANQTFDGINGTYYNGRIIIDSYGMETTSLTNQCFTSSGIAREMLGLMFSGNPQHAAGEYSWIRIQNQGNEQITRIEIIGSSAHNSNAAYLLLDGSTILSPESDAAYESYAKKSALENYMLKSLQGNNASCPEIQSTDLREMWEFWFGLTGEIKTLRLRFSNGTGDITPSQFEQRPVIQAIYIYVEDNGLGTSVNNRQQDSLTISFSKQTIYTTQPAEVTLYNIAGESIGHYHCDKSVALPQLPSGIYIIKAIAENGQTVIKKIII
ncbi:MAG: T9SS type A sorting domain-containing protein [Candidatus Azobacteroides sp.]|nr:T9SS type A sorting domain-containing protein [Candidatus Azobacteroides sp.]